MGKRSSKRSFAVNLHVGHSTDGSTNKLFTHKRINKCSTVLFGKRNTQNYELRTSASTTRIKPLIIAQNARKVKVQVALEFYCDIFE